MSSESQPSQLQQDKELERLREIAAGMGGPEKLARRRDERVLNARERIDHLLDPGSFRESGMLAVSARREVADSTPADGKVAGFGLVDGRHVAVVSNDFTVMGASSSTVNGKKVKHIKTVANRRGLPIVFLGESTGARMPDIMGSAVAMGDDPLQYQRRRETPWAAAVLGHCYGSSAWYSSLSDFCVMRKDAVMAVSSPRLTAMAISEDVDPQDLGGWRIHATKSGLVDLAVDTDEEALDAITEFLSYLPSHSGEPPPRREVTPEDVPDATQLDQVIPSSRTKVYDVHDVISCVVDSGHLFELKKHFARSLVTGLARVDGRTVGILANNPRIKGGAIDPDACAKATSFLVLCDSFNIPIVFLVDQPGFLIGKEGELRGATGRVMNWMNALSLVSVPRISIVLRKSYGQAVLNMGGAGNADEVAAWSTAEVGFMEPAYGVRIVHGVTREDDPDRFEELFEEMNKDTSGAALAAVYAAQEVIKPRETREYLSDILRIHTTRSTGGVGEGNLRTWPTSY